MNTYTPPRLLPGASDRELVLAVLDVLREPQRWTQHEYARTVWGFPTGPLHPLAKCWCASGAARLVSGDAPMIAQRFARAIGLESPPDWNDAPGRTHAEVIARLEAAL